MTKGAWSRIESASGWIVPDWIRRASKDPKLVIIPVGQELFAAGPANKTKMEWGAFGENDIGWYLQGNQLAPEWYLGSRTQRIPIYEYKLVLKEPNRPIMSKVATQANAPARTEPSKFQFFTPEGLGRPRRKRLLGHLEIDGRFVPVSDAA